MSSMLEKILLLKPSTYQFKNAEDKSEYNGFIAQEVMKLFPSLVCHNVDSVRSIDVYTMDYSGFGVLAIKGIQEQQSIIEAQQDKITSLEIQMESLNSLNESLNQRLQHVEALIMKISDQKPSSN